MSADPTTIIAAFGAEPTYSAREASVLLAGATRDLTSGCAQVNSCSLTAPPCSHYGPTKATAASASGWSET
jgi:hypothetical protein